MTPSPRTILPFAILAALIGLLAADAGHAFDCDWNGATTDWATATNWDNCNSGIPGSGDTATIPNTATNDPTIGAATTVTVSGLTIESSRTVTVEGTLNLGNLSGAGDLTVNGAVTWSSGTWSETGATTINGNLTFEDTFTKTLDGRILHIASGGVATWENGSITADNDPLIDNDGTFDIQTHANIDTFSSNYGRFDNSGTVEKTAGTTNETSIEMDFDNTATGTVDVQVGILRLGDTNRNTDGTSSGDFTVANGSVLVFRDSHTLQTGFSISGAGEVQFDTDNHTLASGGIYNVTGTTRRTGSGTTTFNLQPTSVDDLVIEGGKIAFADASPVTVDSLVIGNGILELVDALTDLTVGTTFSQSGGTLTGAGDVTITGATTWSGGTWTRTGVDSPKVTVNGGLTIMGSPTKNLAGRTLHIPMGQTATWKDSGSISADDNPLIDNDGTFDIQTHANINTFNSNYGRFDNSGTVEKTAGTTNETSIEMDFDNTATGTVDVQVGILRLGDTNRNTDGTSSGDFTVANGSVLVFRDSHTLQTGFSISGAGEVQFDTDNHTLASGGIYNVTGTTRRTGSGTTTFNLQPTSVDDLVIEGGKIAFADASPVTVDSLVIGNGILELVDALTDLTVGTTFSQSGGTLTGAGDVTITGATTWSGGTWTRTGVDSPKVTVNGGLTIMGSPTKNLAGRTLHIPMGQTATWKDSGSISADDNPLIDNDGTFDIQTHANINTFNSNYGRFDNSGTVEKTAGTTNETSIEMDFDNTATGTVDVQVGILRLGDTNRNTDGTSSGDFTVANGSVLVFRDSHTLQTGFSISGAGEVEFDTDNHTLASGGIYNVTGTTRRTGSGTTTFNLQPTSVDDLVIEGGKIAFADASPVTVDSLVIGNGILELVDALTDLTVGTTFSQSGGTLTGAGDVTITGATTWSGGTWTRTGVDSPKVTVNGGLTITGSATKHLDGRTLHVPMGQTATWQDPGSISADDDPLIDNDGTFDIQTHANIDTFNSNYGRFDNSGTVQKTAGTTNATTIEMDFDNTATGTVDVQVGILRLGDDSRNTSGTSSGDFTVASGATLRFEENHTLQAGSSVTGNGTVIFNNASNATIVGSWAVDGLTSLGTGATADFDTATSVDFGDLTQTGGTLELSDASISGTFTRSSGTFTHGAGGTLTFDAAGSQNLDLSTATTFVNLAVASGTTLVEVDPADNATITGTLTNDGTIRKTQTISGTGATNYGLTEIDLNTTTLGSLSELQVDRIDDNHPLSTPETFTGRYWTLTPTGGGYTVDLTLLHDGITMPLACRHEGMAVWDCDVDSSTATTVTRTGVTQLSDWAAGDAAPTYSLIIRLGMKTSPEGPIVEWETASHEGVVGFYVERWDEMTGKWLALHGDLLPAALDSPGGAVYRLLDPGADPAAMPRYRVLEVEAGGGDARAHGPYDAPDLGATGSMPHRFVAEPKRPSRELAERLETSRHERTTYDAARALGASVDEALRVAIDGQRLGAPIASRRPSSSLSGLLADGGAPGLGPDEPASLLPEGTLSEAGRLGGGEWAESEIRHEGEEPEEREGHLGTSKVKERFKIVVGGDGIQLLSAAQLATLAGLPEPPVQNAIRKGRLSLSTAGTEVAWQPLAGGTGLVFWGEARESIFSTENTYWLEVARGERMGRVNGGSPTPGVPGVFDDTVHFEESQLAFTVQAEDPEGDFLFWDFLAASSPPYDARQFTLPVQGLSPSGAPGELTVELFGGTDRIPAIDHHAEVSLNGTVLGETTWGGIGTHKATFAVPPGLVVDTNTVTVTSTLQPGVPFSLIYVDSFDLTYERRLDAQGGQLVVSLPTSETVTIEGFTSPEIAVLDVTDPLRPSLVVGTTKSLGTTHEVTFVAEAGATYATADMAALAPPTRLTFEEPTNLTELRGADWVAIAPATLLPGADALALHRQSFGPSTLVVDLEAIYDEFNHGLADPLAIKAFLQAAWTNWSNPPRFAVLVGSGTYDYTDALGFGGNLVPPALRSTPYGLFASDPHLGDVAGNDGVPEIAVGRIPALTAADLDAYVDKLALYEGAAGGGFTEMLLMADDPDEGGDFPADSDALAALAPAGTNLQKVYLPDHTLPNARALVFGAFASGIDIATFLGHGGLTVLTEEGLLTIDDVPALTVGGRLPILASLTCTVGRFEIPGTEALGAALVAEPDAGTAAVWAPSGLSWHDDARPLSEGFVEALFDPSVFTLGDAIRAAQLEGQQGGVPRFMLEVYNLLGDPAVSTK